MKTEYVRRDEECVPWSKLDPGIGPVVRVLDRAGFRTMGSCDGEHVKERAWVSMEQSSPQRIALTLHEAGYRGFTVNERHEFLSPGKRLRFVVVEFWCDGAPKPEARP